MDSYKKNQTFSRWASEEEIKSSLHKVNLNDNAASHGGIPLYYEDGSVYIESTDAHSIIFGITGSKKTRLLGMPSILLYAKAGESFIVTDPKAELYEKTYHFLKEKGYKIFVLNLREPEQSNCWNPLIVPYRLYHSEKRDKAIELINDISKVIMQQENSLDSYWQNSASDMLTGLILILFECAKKSEINFKSLRTLRTQSFRTADNRCGESIPYILDNFLSKINQASFVCSLLSGTVEVCDNTRGCIVSVFDNGLRPFFSQDNLIDMLSNNHFDMKKIGNEKTAVFLIIPDENTLYHRLISVFVKQCYTELIIEAQKQPNKALPLRVNYLLDEFSSLPAISDFPSMITASRSRNIRFNLIIQSFKQLFRRYKEEAEAIKGNCQNWIYLHSREHELLEELSYLSGKKSNEEPLVSPSLLQTLDKEKGEALIFCKRKYPFITNLLDIDDYPGSNNAAAQVIYPKNDRKGQSVFDFELFCSNKRDYFFSQLFSGKTQEEIISKERNNKIRVKFHGDKKDE